MDVFFVRVEKNFCTRTKLFFYVMQIIFSLPTYNFGHCHNAICYRTSTFFLSFTMSQENYEGLTNPYRRIIVGT